MRCRNCKQVLTPHTIKGFGNGFGNSYVIYNDPTGARYCKKSDRGTWFGVVHHPITDLEFVESILNNYPKPGKNPHIINTKPYKPRWKQ